MRTTLTLDDDMDGQLRQIAKDLNRPYKDILNEALRYGIQYVAERPPARSFRVEALDLGFQAGLDLGKLNQLSDSLEAEG